MGEPLQAALPREQYVDPATWRDERDAVLFGEWYCVGRLTPSGSHEPARLAVVDVAGESVLVTSDETGSLHAAYNVCRHRGSQVVPVAEPRRDGDLPGAGAALPVPLVDLRPRRPAAQVAARPGRRPGCVRAVRGGRRDLGRLRLRAPDARARAASRRRGGADGDDARQLRARRPRRRPDATPTTSRPTTRCCSRTTTSATTADRCTPSSAGWCRRSPVAGRPRLGRGDPAPRGRLDLHDVRHHDACAVARSDRGGAHPAQGRPRLPEPHGLRLGRPRRRVHAAPARRRPDRGALRPAVRRRRGGARRLRPLRRRGPLGPGEPAGLGDLRVGAARHDLARLPGRLVRADGGRQPRHPPLAAAAARGACRCRRRATHERARRLRRRRPRRPRQRDGDGARRARTLRRSGWSASSSATATAPATTPAGSCGTATTPRRTSG